MSAAVIGGGGGGGRGRLAAVRGRMSTWLWSLGTSQLAVLLIMFLWRFFLTTVVVRAADVPDEWYQSTEVAYYQVFGDIGVHPGRTWEWREGIRSYFYPLPFIFVFEILKLLQMDNAATLWLAGKAVGALFCAGIDVLVALTFQKMVTGSADYISIGDSKTNSSDASDKQKKKSSDNDDASDDDDEADRIRVSTKNNTGKKQKKVVARKPLNLFNTALLLSATQWYMGFLGTRTLTNVAEAVIFMAALQQDSYLWFLLWAGVGCSLRVTFAIPCFPVVIRFFYYAKNKFAFIGMSLWMVGVVLGLIACVDRAFYGRWICTPLEFFKFNVLQGYSEFYGVNPALWYVTSAFPFACTSLLAVVPFLPTTMSILGARGQQQQQGNSSNSSNKAKKRGGKKSSGVISVDSTATATAAGDASSKKMEMMKSDKEEADGGDDSTTTQVESGAAPVPVYTVKLLLAIIADTVILYSWLPHKEVRFVFPILPLAIVVAALVIDVHPSFARQKGSIWPTARLLIVDFIIYTNIFMMLLICLTVKTGTNTILEKVRALRGEPAVDSLHVWMPCHTTAGPSYFHKKVANNSAHNLFMIDCTPRISNVTHRLSLTEHEVFRREPASAVSLLSAMYNLSASTSAATSSNPADVEDVARVLRPERTNLPLPTHVILFAPLSEEIARRQASSSGAPEQAQAPPTKLTLTQEVLVSSSSEKKKKKKNTIEYALMEDVYHSWVVCEGEAERIQMWCQVGTPNCVPSA